MIGGLDLEQLALATYEAVLRSYEANKADFQEYMNNLAGKPEKGLKNKKTEVRKHETKNH